MLANCSNIGKRGVKMHFSEGIYNDLYGFVSILNCSKLLKCPYTPWVKERSVHNVMSTLQYDYEVNN